MNSGDLIGKTPTGLSLSSLQLIEREGLKLCLKKESSPVSFHKTIGTLVCKHKRTVVR